MRTESEELPHTSEQMEDLASVANDLVKSFTSSHVTEERAEGIRLAFKDVLLVRCALECSADREMLLALPQRRSLHHWQPQGTMQVRRY